MCARSGLPTLRAKLRARDALRVVAIGTSLTKGGTFLAHVGPALQRAAPGLEVRLTIAGYSALDTVTIALAAEEHARAGADLAIIEVGINDHAPTAGAYVLDALYGIVAQLRRHSPSCDVVFAFLGRLSVDRDGERALTEPHRAVADVLAFPSIDLFALATDAIDRGDAVAAGDDDRAITTDGTHPAAAAAEILGVPFAQALLDIAARSGDAVHVLPPFAEVEPVFRTVAGGRFAAGAPRDRFDGEAFLELTLERHFVRDPIFRRNVLIVSGPTAPRDPTHALFDRARTIVPLEAVVSPGFARGSIGRPVPTMHSRDELVIGVAEGAILRFACGPFFCVTGFNRGDASLRVTIDGVETRTTPPPIYDDLQRPIPWILAASHGLADAPHTIEIACASAPIAFGDIFTIAPRHRGPG